MSEIASIKFSIRIESEFKTQLFEADGKLLKFTIRQMNHKDIVNTYPITDEIYEKIDDITKEWSGMYKEKNVKTLDGESWDLSILYADGRKRISSGMNAYPNNYNRLIEILEGIINDCKVFIVEKL